MDDRNTDREKKGKDFDFGAKVANLCTGRFKAKKLKHRVARDMVLSKTILAPFAVSKMLKGIFATIAERAGDSLMPDVSSGVPHSPAGWPTIEKGFHEDTMGGRFDLSTGGIKAIYNSGNRMPSGNAKPKTLKSAPDLVDQLPSAFAVGSLVDETHDIFLQGFLS